jgi:glycosyltransferase involved in cell wall biosynthesis
VRILSLFVRYGDVDYCGAYESLMALYSSKFPDIEIDSVIIDTALPEGTEAHIGLKGLLIGGNNCRREFSAWDQALIRFNHDLHKYDLVHLVTSAFQNEYSGFYDLLCPEMLDYVCIVPHVVLAHIDAYPERVRLFGRGFQTWGCSKFLFMRPVDLKMLGGVAAPFSSEEIFSFDGKNPFCNNAPLSENYIGFLQDWITGDGLPHGKWHSVFNYQKDTVSRFNAKALAILDEHSLSMRIRESGARIVDFTYWYANQNKIWDMPLPDELSQVRNRNSYLFGESIVCGEVPDSEPLDSKSAVIELTNRDSNKLFSGNLIDSLLAGVKMPPEANLVSYKVARASLMITLGCQFSLEENIWLSNITVELEQDASLPITRGLHAVWLARDDLRQNIDLRTKAGREALVIWWIREVQCDARLLSFVADSILGEVDLTLEQDAPLPITRGLHAVWLARDDLRQNIDLRTKAGREALVIWWYRERKKTLSLNSFMPLSVLDDKSIFYSHNKNCYIKKADHLLWCSRNDLRDSFEITSTQGLDAYIDWLSNCEDSRIFSSSHSYTLDNFGYAKNGVNVIGYGKAEFGIAEDVRMVVRALTEVDVETAAPKIDLQIAARQNDKTLLGNEVPRPIYQLNLICLPAYEILRLLASSQRDILDKRYNIGFCQWELSRIPDELLCTLDVMDEIWSASSFTLKAFQSTTSKPVIHMPMTVSLPRPTKKWSRRDFSLSEQDFIYLTVLDGNSSLRRKNPLATVLAFLKAFPVEKNIRLVIKAMNVGADHPEWRRILGYAEIDDRITVISEVMTRERLIGLQSVCDCFVSLHRSEGFGRNIAEAMLLGKPVIVSDYSGNQDFTTKENAFLVSGDLISLKPGDYSFVNTQQWFDPSIDKASAMLKLCFEFPEIRKERAIAGQALILEKYSPLRVGQAYKLRLDCLRSEKGRNSYS